MAGLRRARLAVNKRKTNGWVNKRRDTANKILVRRLLLVARALLNITAIRDEEEQEEEEVRGRRGEVIREGGDRRSDQKGKLIGGYLLNWTAARVPERPKANRYLFIVSPI